MNEIEYTPTITEQAGIQILQNPQLAEYISTLCETPTGWHNLVKQIHHSHYPTDASEVETAFYQWGQTVEAIAKQEKFFHKDAIAKALYRVGKELEKQMQGRAAQDPTHIQKIMEYFLSSKRPTLFTKNYGNKALQKDANRAQQLVKRSKSEQRREKIYGCIDEGLENISNTEPGSGVTRLQALLLSSERNFDTYNAIVKKHAQDLMKAGITLYTTHQGCGAAALIANLLHEHEHDIAPDLYAYLTKDEAAYGNDAIAIRFRKDTIKAIKERYGTIIPYQHITRDIMKRPFTEHIAAGALICSENLLPAMNEANPNFPASFNISLHNEAIDAENAAAIRDALHLSLMIAFAGDHARDEYSDEHPFVINIVCHDNQLALLRRIAHEERLLLQFKDFPIVINTALVDEPIHRKVRRALKKILPDI